MPCPACNSTRIYYLADNRCKCAKCRRVFTPDTNREPRISAGVREQLALFFWEMRGASETSEQLDLNIKTVQKYFSLMRENLAKQNADMLKTLYPNDTVCKSDFYFIKEMTGITAVPVAAITSSNGYINILRSVEDNAADLTLPETTIAWLYARDPASVEHLQLDRFHCISLHKENSALVSSFWLFVKKGLIHYQGGFRHNFFLFLQEMEFRYNDRQQKKGLGVCTQFMVSDQQS